MTRGAPQSLRNRISLVLVLAVTGALAGANGIVYALASHILDQRVDEHLDRSTEFTQNLLVPYSRSPLDRTEQRPPNDNDPLASRYMAVIDPAGIMTYSLFIVVGAESVPPVVPRDLPSRPGETASYRTTGHVDGHQQDFQARAIVQDDGTVAFMAVQTTAIDRDRRSLLFTQAATSLVVLALLALLSRWLVGVGLRPLARMERTAQRIASGELTHRVEPSGPDTEISRLGASLNRMLVTIEQAFAIRQESEQRLRSSRATLRRFAADASHELRTPLTSIRGYAQLLRRARIQDADEASRAAARIEDEAGRLAALVEDLLLLAQLDERAPPAHQTVNIGTVVAQAVDDRRVIESSRTISYQADAGTTVEGDAHQLARVITNLLTNACQHTPPGSPVEVVVRKVEDRVEVDVVDHGEGIPAAERAHLFGRFVRADSSRTRATGGAGLGLAIVASVLEAHQGDCTILDTPGGGATFRVSLPATPPEPEPPTPDTQDTTDAGGTEADADVADHATYR